MEDRKEHGPRLKVSISDAGAGLNAGIPKTFLSVYRHQAQILRSLILFVLPFNKTKARTSLNSWVRDILPKSISLAVLIGCPSVEGLPPLGSYYDFMDRFWLGQRDTYPEPPCSQPAKTARSPKRSSAQMASVWNRKTPARSLPRRLSMISWTGNPPLTTRKRPCRRSFPSSRSSLCEMFPSQPPVHYPGYIYLIFPALFLQYTVSQ